MVFGEDLVWIMAGLVLCHCRKFSPPGRSTKGRNQQDCIRIFT